MENFIFCAVSMIEIKMKISNKDIKFIFQEIRCKHDMKITIIGSPKFFFFFDFFFLFQENSYFTGYQGKRWKH